MLLVGRMRESLRHWPHIYIVAGQRETCHWAENIGGAARNNGGMPLEVHNVGTRRRERDYHTRRR
jgi:hypothetical protein